MQFYENSIFFLSKSKVIVLSCFFTAKTCFPWETWFFFLWKIKWLPWDFFSTHLKLPKKDFQTSPCPAFTPPFWVICHIPYVCFLKKMPAGKNLEEISTKIKHKKQNVWWKVLPKSYFMEKKTFFNFCSIFVKKKQ